MPRIADVVAVGCIVSEEADEHRVSMAQARVAQTAAALRTLAAGVVEAELRRLSRKAPALDECSRAEVERSMRRVIRELLHPPTARMKELASVPDGGSHAAMLGRLFGLGPAEGKRDT
jgi:glutamyl-tRNA reductase